MDHRQSASGKGDDDVGIPDDLRCKRSDGKQWRCTAMSMPDKTVCEKHYIQAKKRAASSAMRANMKKAKNKSLGESDIYLESNSDDDDMPLVQLKVEEYTPPVSRKNYTEMASKNQFRYSPETSRMRISSPHNPPELNGDSQKDFMQYEKNCRSSKTSPLSAKYSSRNRSQRSFDVNAMAVLEYSDRSTESSEETGGQTCHQCQRNDRGVIWCLRCDRRGYCDSCVSKWYSDISLEEIQKICPACRGTCNCKACLRADNLIKVRIKEIPVLNKLQYLHSVMFSVLPIVKRIHHDQCSEVELEKKLRGTDIDLNRTRLNADEQMCCNFCRIPIVDYHRHCAHCSYDLCLSCSLDLREASASDVNGEVVDNKISDTSLDKETMVGQQKVRRVKLNFLESFRDWKAKNDGSIPCPPKEYGGCDHPSLNLSRIFKMNWVAKLVKNVEEMVSGCKIYDAGSPGQIGSSAPRYFQYAHRGGGDGDLLYCPSSQHIKTSGIGDFRNHWARGEPIIVKEVFDSSSTSSWDPMVIWSGIQETADEKLKEENRMVKAIDCFNGSEVDIELDQFIRGYSEGRMHENGCPQLLKLKDWPSPSASEEFLLYQRSEFISKLPLLEYIHSKWGLLNVAAKLPHYSLQTDAGPKICMSYGSHDELGRGDCVTNLHFNIRDMVYLLVHTREVKPPGMKKSKIEKVQESFTVTEVDVSPGNPHTGQDEIKLPDVSLGNHSMENQSGERLDDNEVDKVADRGIDNTSSTQEDTVNHELSKADGVDVSKSNCPGVLWDVFCRKDVPKLVEYLRIHWKEIKGPNSEKNDFVIRTLYDEKLFLNRHHKRKLKEDFGVVPWSFEQYAGQAVFVPTGCPFQFRNLQSTVQLGLNFLSPESLGEAVRLAEDIRCLPNDHQAKLEVLEVGKISLYAASSAIKEVQKLVLDPKLGTELGFGDSNLTAVVYENLEKMIKPTRITCA